MHKRGLSIDRVTRSHRNTFTSVRLDRLVDQRDDGAWLRAARQGSKARFVPLWRNLSLLQNCGGEQRAIYLKPGEIQFGGEQSPTLLGTDSKRCFFAVPVDDGQKNDLLAHYPGSAFQDLRLASVDMDAKHAGVLAYAKALLYWQYRHAFCGICGAPNRLKSAGHRFRCSNDDCRRESFPRIDPAIIVLVTHGDACLLGRNARWPEKRFSTLAGFVEPGESLEDAVAREVFEESHVRLDDIRYISSQPWPFPSSAMCGFYAEALSRDCSTSDEMEQLRWQTAEQLKQAIEQDIVRVPPPVSIAFRLIADWYRQQCGGSLEEVARNAGSWLPRKGIE